jgi:prolyl-tRNA synthetase
MKYSKLFGKTLKETPKDASLASHKLLYQAGYIRESTAGRYFLLPLGLRVQQKIQQIIKEEMDNAGAQELLAPVLHPKQLWQETNRTNSVGFELMSIKDRNEMEFVLGGTAEEMMVDVVRKFQISYKDLPFNIYQFSIKFRDEMRARGGLLRLREFIMKDAYSFHQTEEDFKKEYENMKQTYMRIFHRLGLKTLVVESDNGYIGGEYCHEFVVESDAGESKFFMTEDGSYAAHEEVARFKKEEKNIDEALKPIKEVKAERGKTMEDGAKIHGLPMWQQIKDVLFVDENGRFILAIIRGDFDVNETKLLHLVKAYTLRHATEDEIHKKIQSEPGFISPVGIKENLEKGVELVIVADDSLRTIKNAYGGANKKHLDLFNMNIDRDYQPDIEGDIALAQAGFETEDGKKLSVKKGIEVGNIFQLGFHYSTRMKDATFTDTQGEKKPYYMGCYGIGLARTLSTVVEMYNDEKGIAWPLAVAPFQVHLIGLWGQDEAIKEKTERLYKELTTHGIEVLYDDRDGLGPGQRFGDADLIGIPVRLVVSPKTEDKIEWKQRGKQDTEMVDLETIKRRLGKHDLVHLT